MTDLRAVMRDNLRAQNERLRVANHLLRAENKRLLEEKACQDSARPWWRSKAPWETP